MYRISEMLYLSEIVSILIAWISGVIIYKVSHRKGLLKYFGTASLVFAILFAITFLFERPQMYVNNTVNFEVGTDDKIQKPRTIYHFQDVTDKVRVTGKVDIDKIGKYDINYEIDTLIGTYSIKAQIRVIDTKAPIILLEGGEEYNQSYTKEYAEPGFTAIDEYEGDLTEKVNVEKEKIDETCYNLIYKVQDSSGNIAQVIRKINIIDDISPILTLNGSTNMTVFLNGKYEEKGAKAQDEKDGDLTNKITIDGNVNTAKVGKYTLTYTVLDNSGNKATKNRNVSVIEKSNKAVSTVKAQDGTSGPKGVIYLTFDDGPSTSTTPKILDILKEKNVKATFFILNYTEAGEKIVKREIAEGHTVGIHGYSHVYKDIYKSVDAYMENITKLQQKLLESTGYNATITRFPGGSSNTVSRFNPGIMTILCKEVIDRGYKYFDWNVSSGDAGGAKTADDVYNNVVRGLSKSKQNVVLFHDIKTTTMNALTRIIDYGIANGYTFERITENTPMVTHKPNN